MTVIIKKSKATGEVFAPPSKSISHRALICGAFTRESTVKNVAFSDDITATLNCLKGLGARVEINGDTVILGGLNPFDIKDNTVIDCFESGSTLRFLIPVCMLSGKRVTFTGSERLFARPLTVYEEICKENGIDFEKSRNSLTVCGNLRNNEFDVLGDISSQFISGLLFALPFLPFDSKINILGTLESAPYIDLTADALKSFGVETENRENTFFVKGNSRYKSNSVTIEGDCSNAAFLDAFNLLGGNVTVKGLKENTLQGDRVYADMFKALKNGEKQFDLRDCPDLAPVMFALSSLFGGAVFTGTKRLKLKESNRISAMAEELNKFGVTVTEKENSAEVVAKAIKKPSEALYSHNDHRIAMALTLLCSVTSGEICDAQSVNKSFPDFYEKISSLGIEISYENA